MIVSIRPSSSPPDFSLPEDHKQEDCRSGTEREPVMPGQPRPLLLRHAAAVPPHCHDCIEPLRPLDGRHKKEGYAAWNIGNRLQDAPPRKARAEPESHDKVV